MKRHFYFFRHGDRNGIEPEMGLSATGIAQAQKLSAYLADKNIDAVYSSPLHRAIETAKIAINNPDIEIITDDRLIETTFGFWYGETDEIQKRDPSAWLSERQVLP